MHKLFISAAVLSSSLMAISPVIADDDEREGRYNTTTLAVFGDSPYGCKAPSAAAAADECPVGSSYRPDNAEGPNPGDRRQLDATPGFISAINSDPAVSLVVHTGDIHSGSQYCTLAYNRTVFNLWKQFKDPLVYTPGDNEWADCQKSKEGGGVKNAAGDYVDFAAGHPVANLQLVRSMFFPNAGETLGGRKKHVISQAQAFDPLHPADAEYVENVIWTQSQAVIVTVNIPGGSNNDDDQWNTGAFGAARSGPQIQEVAQRNAADLRWLDAAFAKANAEGAKAVVIVEQADMWDQDNTGSSTHIAKYEPFIAKIAEKALSFGKPVLLINGDSHNYRSDNPLKAAQPCVIESGAGTIACSAQVSSSTTLDAYDTHPGYEVPNFHRLVVHGSTFPLEYIRLTVNPAANVASSASAFGPLSWARVAP